MFTDSWKMRHQIVLPITGNADSTYCTANVARKTWKHEVLKHQQKNGTFIYCTRGTHTFIWSKQSYQTENVHSMGVPLLIVAQETHPAYVGANKLHVSNLYKTCSRSSQLAIQKWSLQHYNSWQCMYTTLKANSCTYLYSVVQTLNATSVHSGWRSLLAVSPGRTLTGC